MPPARIAALLWILAAVAFVIAAILSPNAQLGFFGVAVLFAAVAIVSMRKVK